MSARVPNSFELIVRGFLQNAVFAGPFEVKLSRCALLCFMAMLPGPAETIAPFLEFWAVHHHVWARVSHTLTLYTLLTAHISMNSSGLPPWEAPLIIVPKRNLFLLFSISMSCCTAACYAQASHPALHTLLTSLKLLHPKQFVLLTCTAQCNKRLFCTGQCNKRLFCRILGLSKGWKKLYCALVPFSSAVGTEATELQLMFIDESALTLVDKVVVTDCRSEACATRARLHIDLVSKSVTWTKPLHVCAVNCCLKTPAGAWDSSLWTTLLVSG